MRTLSIKQPWAHLIAIGLKDVENRSRPISYRGEILIHASKAIHDRFKNTPGTCFGGECASAINKVENLAPTLLQHNFIMSAIIGKVEIVDCINNSSSIWAESGQWHWVLKNAIMFKNPILNVNGKLSLWHYDLPEGWFAQ